MGRLVNFYWGERLLSPSDYPTQASSQNWASFSNAGQLAREEYPAETGLKYIEPCFKAYYADGVRDTVLEFEKAEVQGAELRIHLMDALEQLSIILHYRLHETYDLIERWAEVTNRGETAITLERVLSAQWHLPRKRSYRLSHLYGRWADEWNIKREALAVGKKILESRRITTSHHGQPWFAVDGGTADEEQGEVWFGALAWSGNWKFIAETTEFGATRLSLGLNDWDFAWRLKPGKASAPQRLSTAIHAMALAKPAGGCTITPASRCCRMARHYGRCCTTRGKPPPLMWTRHPRWSWQSWRRKWGWNCS